jgi:hypothetical protein
MMAQAVPNPPNDKKRVKVYELRNNDWFDRGNRLLHGSLHYLYVLLALSHLVCWSASPSLSATHAKARSDPMEAVWLTFVAV